MPGNKSRVPKEQFMQIIWSKRTFIGQVEKIISKTNGVWQEFSKSVGNRYVPNTIYSMVIKNVYNLRDEVLRSQGECKC